MSIPLALFKFAARAGLNAVGFGVAGDFAVEVLPSIVKDVWGWWAPGKTEAELRADVQAVARLTDAEARQEAEVAVAAEASGESEAVRRTMVGYLTRMPAVVRQTQRRPADPSGRTLSPSLALRRPDDLLTLFPARLPRFQPGDRAPGFPDWTLDELLGVGGFGEVWRATNPHLPAVALKFCLDAAAARTLRNEAALLGRVATQGRHPGIVALLDTALGGDPPCLKYEYVPGGDLAGLVAQWHNQPTPRLHEQVCLLLRDLTGIVGFAHRLNPPIVHRDLKPANVLLQSVEAGRVRLRVADFGIGGIATRRAAEESRAVSSRGHFLTSALRGACTPLYASPQQLHGEDPDPRDDVYSLGVVWLQMLTGDLTTGATADWREDLAERKVPAAMVDLLGACLASRAERRPADGAALAERLTELVGVRGAGAKAVAPGAESTACVPAASGPPCACAWLPPPAPEVTELEGRLAGVEKTLGLLEGESHPALTAAREEVEAAGRRARQLEAEAGAGAPPLEPGQREALVGAVAADPRGPVAPLLELAPQASTKVLLPYIHRLRDAEKARLADASARERYATLRRGEIDAARKQTRDLSAELLRRQSEELGGVLRAFFERVGPAESFPLREWVELEGELERRRFRLDPKQMLARAEEAFGHWRQFGDVTPPGVVVNAVGMRLVLIRPGRFRMGSLPNEPGRRADEGPAHEVTISRGFYLGACLVTQEQYQAVRGTNPSTFARTGAGRERVAGLDTGSFPVDGVSWEDAVAFCERLSERPAEREAGRSYRLPTEAEWEFACRAGTTGAFHTGESLSSAQANFNGQHPGGGAAKGPSLQRPCPVGAYPPNPWGLYDVLGNLWEWCADFYSEKAYAEGPVTDPKGPATGAGRVLRGGAWDVGGELCRCATRNTYRPGWERCFGFRVVMEVKRV